MQYYMYYFFNYNIYLFIYSYNISYYTYIFLSCAIYGFPAAAGGIWLAWEIGRATMHVVGAV